MFTDYHVHTEFSDDSEYPMEQVVRDAIAMGMEEICFTDHVDYGIKEDWDCGYAACSGSESELRGQIYPLSDKGDTSDGEDILPVWVRNVNYPVYTAKIKEMQNTYGAQIAIKLGLEFGVQMHTIPQYEALFHRYPFDFIILSIHQVEDQEFWTQDFQRGKSQQEYNERYYDELLNVVKAYHDYSVLGHMDLITRYDENGVYPFEKVEPVITEILKTVIADGKGIEFNTSYHRYGLKDTTPSVEILKLYRRLGGEIITIGSDSHEPQHLGAYVGEAKQLLQNLGFRYVCTFDKMKPVYHELCR